MSKVNVINGTVDGIELIRQKSNAGFESDEPLYICNISDVIQKLLVWKSLMPRVVPFYAVKCNDDPVVIKTLSALEAGFDCASKGEIQKVISHGVRAESIVFAQPHKPISHLEYAAKVKVNLMTVDNDNELHKIAKHYPPARILLRIRYDAVDAQFPLGGKYGCDPICEAPGLIELSKSLGLNMVGICFHIGSNCMNPSVFGGAIATARDLFDFAESVGYHFNLVDIGGGFPGHNFTNIREHASIINSSIEVHFPSSNVTFISEPGHYFVASAFTLACTVHSVRDIRENGRLTSKMYFINDSVFGSFLDVLCTKVFHPDRKIVEPLTLKSSASEEMFNSTIWGQTCHSIDAVCEDVRLPRLDINDVIIFENMGGYTTVTATRFNGFDLPKVEYYIERKDWEKLQNIMDSKQESRITSSDIFR